ncbi:malate:quinone oxidoreductase [Frigoribacterium faeni]|uniref:Probable malate:quinone oxidoreductase n=1 Tax=Frigoribacterium faeni TaxID=145483 RepID=A0A7W3JG20_9MICO|nr:malate:quinone oxidoreductase [Frigoribacterium faeni]MBA8812207.1 malate dehydrogenase (quinone) [Frigoribacterium faeni]GEK83220.1 putative malate:quinone oxidoreductase 1 [Frigoribacterium faeni]
MNDAKKPVDVALIGGGVMSATLGAMIKQLEPDWSIEILEALDDVALESSNPWNNAGTGHSALCELNYTPEKADGMIDTTSAVKVNEQFQVSRQFWSYLVAEGALPEPDAFINSTPHMSFVWGDKNVEYLRKRHEALRDHPLFQGLEFSTDRERIAEWAPLLTAGRALGQPIAATRIAAGTDVDFGSLTRLLMTDLQSKGAVLELGHRVTDLTRRPDGGWRIAVRPTGGTARTIDARFVFVGAGGGALHLLQKSGIREIEGFGGFPVSGEFLRTDDPAVVARHQAKVYGKAAVGSPPMSVPHLDTRVVDGQASLMFGPYAGFSPKFLKSGSWFDLFASIRPHNLYPMIRAGVANLSLVKYLVGQLLASKSTKFEALREFVPDADPKDWYRITAGQRVQVIKKDPKKGGVLQFGTEVVAAADGTIAGLLGASPGASTAVPIMLDVLQRCFPSRIEGWQPTLRRMIPTYGEQLATDEARAAATLGSTAEALRIQA